MRALRMHGWGQMPRVEDVVAPPVGEGEVLVAVQAAAVSHLDLTVASGTFGFKPTLPYTPGVEGSGVVVGAAGLAEGTQVLVRGAGLGLRRDGTWAEFVSVPAKAVMALPVQLEPAVAATYFQPTATAYIALHDIARLTPGEHIVVVGAAGAVGTQVVQQALRAGATVTGVVGSKRKIDRVASGAHAVSLDDVDAIAALSAQRGATLLVDTVGGPGLADRVRWVAPGGRAVLVGYVAGGRTEIDLPSWLLDDVALLPVNMIRREARARELAGELAHLLAAGDLTHEVETYPPERISDAVQRLGKGEVHGRAVVTFVGN